MGHKKHCKKCKKNLLKGLKTIDPKLQIQVKNPFPPDPLKLTENLSKIHSRLVERTQLDKRNSKGDVLATRIGSYDYYLPKFKCFVEFDEQQHFTLARAEALKLYPKNTKLGFDKKEWLRLCQTLNRVDLSPPHRDEQRAWLDTIRDLGPLYAKEYLNDLGRLNPTVRIYEGEMAFCQTNEKSIVAFLKSKLAKASK